MTKGVIAAGHQLTANAAEAVLKDGGNAFDAIIAGFYAACLAEPVLCSPGGGGFLLARQAGKKPVLYDFFVQTPQYKNIKNLDFSPIYADFGHAQQEFHIGYGSIAVPGAIKGIFDIYRDLATLPMRRLVEPALDGARAGIRMNHFQAYIFEIIAPIFLHSEASKQIFGSHLNKNSLLTENEIYYPSQLAATLEALAIEGDRLFYEGELARMISQACADGKGLIGYEDLVNYQCIKRKPLNFKFRGCTIITNPPPASGGTLIAFGLKLIERAVKDRWSFGKAGYLLQLAEIMRLTQLARQQAEQEESLMELLSDHSIGACLQQIKRYPQAHRGTTHMSIIDEQGNMASMTLSNGEGCGYMLGDSGIMLNNMLGEEDLNPDGFFNWQTGIRMTSMMSPSLLFMPDGRKVVTGSGGSNRIRTALMQVMINLVDHKMNIADAVNSPRLHIENNRLNIEGLFRQRDMQPVLDEYPEHQISEKENLFFGGAHSVIQEGKSFSGAGDPRRGGVALNVN